MKSATFGLLISLVLWTAGCALTYDRANYEMGLTQVERPTEAKERYGEQRIEQIQEEGVQKYRFEDELVSVTWWPTPKQIHFMLINKTEHSIKIVWDEAAYVDPTGASHRVIHSGTKYTDANSPQPPTVVVRKGTVTDFILPADYVAWLSTRWIRKPLLIWTTKSLLLTEGLGSAAKNKEDLVRISNEYVGKTFQVLLPLQIKGVVNEYLFVFNIDSCVVEPYEVKI